MKEQNVYLDLLSRLFWRLSTPAPSYVTNCLQFVICPNVSHFHSCCALLSGHGGLWSFPLHFISFTHFSAEGSLPPKGTDYSLTWTRGERAPIPMPVNLSHKWIISLLLPPGKNVKHFYGVFFFSGWEEKDEYVLPRHFASSPGNDSWPHGQWYQLAIWTSGKFTLGRSLVFPMKIQPVGFSLKVCTTAVYLHQVHSRKSNSHA